MPEYNSDSNYMDIDVSSLPRPYYTWFQCGWWDLSWGGSCWIKHATVMSDGTQKIGGWMTSSGHFSGHEVLRVSDQVPHYNVW